MHLYHTDRSLILVELGDQVYRQSDLDMFFKQYSPELVRKNPTLVSITGGE